MRGMQKRKRERRGGVEERKIGIEYGEECCTQITEKICHKIAIPDFLYLSTYS